MVGQLSWLPCVETEVEPPDELLAPPVGVVVPPVELVVPPVDVVVPPEELVEPPVEVVVPPVDVVPPDEPVWPPVDVEPLDDPVTCVPGELIDPLPVELLDDPPFMLLESHNPGTAAKISWRSWRISCNVSGAIVLVVLSSRRSSRASTVNVVLRVFRAVRPDVRGAPGEWGEPKNGSMDPSFTERETVRGVLPRDTVIAQNPRTANQAGHSAAHRGCTRRRRAKPGHTGKAGKSEKRVLGRTLARPRVPVRDAADQSHLCTREHAGKQRQSVGEW
jgi:hypothetical protein